ncbi:MAG: YidC/Oxa1 family membrane protein insertase [Chloroflexota bacterium]|nr:YidC/Oxa1 family membrane protein insertase [Chloroflexota bacterium]
MLNTLLVFYVLFFNQMGIAIIVFTLLIRLITLPLTLKQIRQMRAMTTLQPKMKEIQERYSGDRARISQETMKMYKDAGVSPLGCVGPLIIQLPILIGLFRVLIQVLPTNPDDLVGVADRLYAWVTFVPIHQAAPLNDNFLWLNLAEPDPTNIVLPVLVAASTWVQQKMTMTPSIDPRQQSTQNMMLWMMPIFLGVFSLGWPSGLPLYWIVSNAVGIGIQYFITGFGPLFPLFPKPEPVASRSQSNAQKKRDRAPEEIDDDGRTGNTNRQNRRRSRRTGSERTRRRPQRGRGRNTK